MGPRTAAEAADLASLLRPSILRGIERRRPHHGPRGAGVFSGSYDWHSCVHAHWALLSMARRTADRELRRFLRGRLTYRALRDERDFLRTAPRFEIPYGRAWLFLMLSEAGRVAPWRGRRETRDLLRETRDLLLDWMEENPERLTSAGHDSWLFAFFALVAGGASGPRLGRLRREVLDPARAKVLRKRHRPADFLDLPSLLSLIEGTFHPPQPPRIGTITRGNVHACGRAVVCLWPPDAPDFDARMERILGRTGIWRDDFALVSHWIPQFLWMARALRTAGAALF